jgi:NAD(P)-dependent dehydrogenase (short-subunit alcohol dehydrogenase family)
MSKAALNMFGRTLAIEWPHAVVLSLHPGHVATDMGGDDAQLSVDESSSAMRALILSAKPEQSGKLLDHKGNVLPW